MDPITKFAWKFSARAREKRGRLFRELFHIDGDTKILDIGSADGSNIFSILKETDFAPENVYIADINSIWLEQGRIRYGFETVLIDETGKLPFPDGFFDIVYCSSVIEHVTVPKSEIWEWKSGARFRGESRGRQKALADEITRLGKQYFVQTPSKTFPVESHTWLPFAGYLPRNVLLPVVRLSNRYWVRYAEPDFCLLGRTDMKELFPDAAILNEKKFGFTKSLMAVKADSAN